MNRLCFLRLAGATFGFALLSSSSTASRGPGWVAEPAWRGGLEPVFARTGPSHGRNDSFVAFAGGAQYHLFAGGMQVSVPFARTPRKPGLRLTWSTAGVPRPPEGDPAGAGQIAVWSRGGPVRTRRFFRSVCYNGVLPGIDLRFHPSGSMLEHDWIVAPGADPSAIRFRLTGSDELRLGSDGAIRVQFAEGTLALRPPRAFQCEGIRRFEVRAKFARVGEDCFGYELAGYDRSRELVIDPVVDYSTVVAGDLRDSFNALVRAGDGSLLVGGGTNSRDLFGVAVDPALGPERSIGFVARLTADGRRLQNITFLPDTEVTSLAILPQGDVAIGGSTRGLLAPVLGGPPRLNEADMFNGLAAVLSSDLQDLRWAAHVGGKYGDRGTHVAAGPDGSVYLAGATMSPNLTLVNPLVPGDSSIDTGFGDAFLTRLSPDGSRYEYLSIVASRYGLHDRPTGLQVDASGAAIVSVESRYRRQFSSLSKIPAEGGVYGWVTTRSGLLVASSLTAGGDLWVTGSTSEFGSGRGISFVPTRTILHRFAAATGNETFFCQLSPGFPRGIAAVDGPEGTVMLVGALGFGRFVPRHPLQLPPRRTAMFSEDIGLVQLDVRTKQVLWSSQLGGMRNDRASGHLFVPPSTVWVAGTTQSTNFPLMQPSSELGPGQLDGSGAPEGDGFLTSISLDTGETRGRLEVDAPRAVVRLPRAGLKAVHRFRLKNTGAGQLSGTVADPVKPYSVLSGGGNFVIEPGAERELVVGFSPEDPGRFDLFLPITTNDPRLSVRFVEIEGLVSL